MIESKTIAQNSNIQFPITLVLWWGKAYGKFLENYVNDIAFFFYRFWIDKLSCCFILKSWITNIIVFLIYWMNFQIFRWLRQIGKNILKCWNALLHSYNSKSCSKCLVDTRILIHLRCMNFDIWHETFHRNPVWVRVHTKENSIYIKDEGIKQ